MLENPRLAQARHTLTHWQVTPSASRRVLALAQTVRAIRPGVYLVGACVVDHWRGSCSCKQARQNKTKKCAHKLAVEIAALVECPPDGYSPETRRHFEMLGYTQPKIVAIYCRAKLPACYPSAPLGFRVVEIVDGLATLENLATGTHADVPATELTHVFPFYE